MLHESDEQAAWDPEEFRDKLSLFRFTPSAHEQQLLDELLFASIAPAEGKKPAPAPVVGFDHLAVTGVN